MFNIDNELATYHAGKDAETRIRDEFFPDSTAALDARDHAALAEALPREERVLIDLVGVETATLFTIRYSIGLRRIKAVS